jgi:translocator protein
MKLKSNYFFIAAAVLAVAAVGTLFTTPNIPTWYATLTLPSFAPPGQVIGLVWTFLYVLIAASIILFWNRVPHGDSAFRPVLSILIVNGILNAGWSYVFFSLHQVGFAIFVSAFMALTIYGLIYLLWKPLRTAAYLLIPYAAWVTFATFLNYVIFTLNK